MLKDYIRDYNTTFHRGIDGIPLERYQVSKDHPRRPQSRQWPNDCFYNRITRKVRKDSTITIDKVCYDVPMQFISAKVDVRYLPNDMTSAYILSEEKNFLSVRRTVMTTATRNGTIFRQSITQRLEVNPDVQRLLRTYLQSF